jgi:hypothetical protein
VAPKSKPAHHSSKSRPVGAEPSPTSALTVGFGIGFDEEAVKRDLEAIEIVEKEDDRKLLKWCEKKPAGSAPRFRTYDLDPVKEAPTVGNEGGGGVFFIAASQSVRASASVTATHTTGDEIWSEERSLLEEIDNFPKDGVPSDLDHLFEKLADIYNDRGDRVGAMNVLLTLLEKYDPNK